MKSRFLVFTAIVAVIIFLYKRLLDTQEKLVIVEAERNKLQREQDAIKESFTEANQQYQKFNKAHPLPDDPDKKLRVAMLDAIHSANAREYLGENHLDFEDEEDDS